MSKIRFQAAAKALELQCDMINDSGALLAHLAAESANQSNNLQLHRLIAIEKGKFSAISALERHFFASIG